MQMLSTSIRMIDEQRNLQVSWISFLACSSSKKMLCELHHKQSCVDPWLCISSF
ncbi:hypothetical protein Hdeb2414_s0006g00190451 [Helianthus debilis subsp. tardiflorus]